MRKTNLKKLLALIIALIMVASSLTYIVSAAENGAEEPPQDGLTAAEIDDGYSSPWAFWDIFMAENVYGLGERGTYSNFKGHFTWEKFKPALESMTLKFGIESEWPDGRYEDGVFLTRGEVISDLHVVIATILEFSGLLDDSLDYFVENGLIKGRGNGDYQLDAACTTEEMIILAKRVHEHIIYELGLDSKGFFWKVTGENNDVYILGSIHISDGSLYPVSRAISAAFDGAEYIGFEIIDVTEEEEAYYYEKGFLDGMTIDEIIDPYLYEFYEVVWQMLGVEKEIYDYLQPWMAWSELQYILMAMTGDENETIDDIFYNMLTMMGLGIDNYFMFKSTFDEKEMFQLESVTLQADMFASFSYELQEALLAGVLMEFYMMLEGGEIEDEEIDESEDYMSAAESLSAMLIAWKTGDEAAMLEFSGKNAENDDPLVGEYNNKLLTLRDIAMAEKIILILDESEGEGDYFIIVGAAHLVGEGSIIDILIKAGYEVERIK